eukprot:COSAG06_NODE_366_length_16768_cov_145.097246_3_plen_480_part_00
MHRKLTPKAARSKMMYEHPVLFAERKEVREARARDLQNALKKTAATEAERNPFGRRSTAASAAWGAVLDAADVGTDPRARRGENAMIWRATQLLAGSRPDSEELLAKLNAYELKEYKYFSLNTAMAEKARDDTAEAAAEVAKLVEGPDGIVFQHRARLSGRPLETVGEGGETMGREQRRLVLQALIAAKEAANGIIAATDEFSLRPANVLDRLPGLAEEEALDAKRMAAHAKLVEQAKINQAMFEEAKRERDEAVGFVARIPKEDLNELKQYRTPPESVRRTLVAVVTLLTGSLAVVDLKYTELLLAFQNLAKGKLMTALRLAETLRHDVAYAAIQFALLERLRLVADGLVGGRALTATEDGMVGFSVGLCTAALTEPLDLVRTRLMVQKQQVKDGARAAAHGGGGSSGAAGRSFGYRGVFHGLASAAGADGLVSLWRGLLPRLFLKSVGSSVWYTVYMASRRHLAERRADEAPDGAAG